MEMNDARCTVGVVPPVDQVEPDEPARYGIPHRAFTKAGARIDREVGRLEGPDA